jgi:GT2 family glycosyltransferase
VACVTGAVLPLDLRGEGACLFEFEFSGLDGGPVPRRFGPAFLERRWWNAPPVWRIGAGANMAIRRAAFAKVGLFDPRLGAGAAGCSEDSELWFRLLRAGMVCVYDPAVVVRHRHRQDRAALRRQLEAYIRGHFVALLAQFAQDRRVGHLMRAFVRMPAYYASQLLRALAGANRARLWMLTPQILGLLSGPFEAARRLRRPGPPPLTPDARDP